MLEYVTQPRPFVLTHAPKEPTRHPIGTAVFGQSGKGLRECIDETTSKPAGGPLLELAEV
jgi:hypothetical protein